MSKTDMSVIGKQFNNLIVKGMSDKKTKDGRTLWRFECVICGKERIASLNEVKRGNTKDCGNHKRIRKDLTGQRFGKLVAMNYIDTKESNSKNKTTVWHCKCDCGNEVDVHANHLLSGRTKSCGCLSKLVGQKIVVEGTVPEQIENPTKRKTNTSGVIGVWFDKSRGKWTAEIMFRKKKYYLGRYEDFNDAVKARKAAEEEIFGDFLDWYHTRYPNGRQS